MSKRTKWILIVAAAILAVVVIVIIVLLLLNQQVKGTDQVSPPASQSASPSTSETPSPPSATPLPTPSVAPLAADALIVVRATATDASGAQLALRMVVHKPVSKNAPAASADLARFVDRCTSDPNWATEAERSAGIERVDVTATPRGTTTWPRASEVSVFASNNNILLRSGVGLASSVHYANHPPLHRCERLTGLYGQADGTVSVLMWARPGFGMPVQSPNIFRWQNWEYGFTAAGGPDGPVTVSDCTVTVTDAANDFGFDPSIWRENADSYICEGSGADF
jgi:hypothetical protein